MEIPNYDTKDDSVTNYKHLYLCMPCKNFRMLISGPSGSGKTNTLRHMLMKSLIYYDKLYLYAKTLERGKYKNQ